MCHAFCSKVQAASTDLFFGAGGAARGRLRREAAEAAARLLRQAAWGRAGYIKLQVRDPPYPGSGECMVTCHRRTVPPGSERDVRRTARVFLLWLEYHSNRTVWELRGVRWEESGGRSEGPVGCRLPEERRSEESANGSCTVAGQRLRGKLSSVPVTHCAADLGMASALRDGPRVLAQASATSDCAAHPPAQLASSLGRPVPPGAAQPRLCRRRGA